MRLPLLCALNFAVLAGGMTTTASDLSRPLGDPQLERPTLRSLGVYWIIQGDDIQNAFIALGYRKAGSSPWRTAARLFRSEKDFVHIFASTNGGTTWRAVADMKGPRPRAAPATSALRTGPGHAQGPPRNRD